MSTMGKFTSVVATVLALGAIPAASQNVLGVVNLHGYGGWAYGETDGNVYLAGTEAGNYDNANFALNISATPAEKLTIFGQFQFHAMEGGDEVELDYAFAEWRFSDMLRLRLGQVKQPFGIYTEIFDVGTLRPFFDLPRGVYGPQGIVAEAYRGAGVAGVVFSDGGWGLQYDLYLGGLEAQAFHPGLAGISAATGEDLSAEDLAFDSRDLIGGRAVIISPIPGLTFGASFYTGEPDQIYEDDTQTPGFDFSLAFDDTRTTWGLQFEYLGDALWVRAEYAVLDVADVKFAGSYAEIAYKLGAHWQIAGRYDRADISGVGGDPVMIAFELFEHEDVAAALNYWFAPELVVRLEYHRVDGTRFAAPDAEDYMMDFLTGDFRTETDLVQLGVQFSF